MDARVTLDFLPAWMQVTPALSAELVDLWRRNHALANPQKAKLRSLQAVSLVRDGSGRLCGVATAVLRTLPRLRQPLYYYRQYFAPEIRGQGQALPFFLHARKVLQEWNAAQPEPESLGLLLEVENRQLQRHYALAHERAAADAVFIGYSPKGLPLRASYFDDARLLPLPAAAKP
jgi:hypothetical protein